MITVVADRMRDEDVSPLLVELTAARLQPGATLLIEPTRRRWNAAGFNWHGERLVRPVGHSHATRTLVKRVEHESFVASVGTRTEIIVSTMHGVLVCAPATVLHILRLD